jgi:hypothetical protein
VLSKIDATLLRLQDAETGQQIVEPNEAAEWRVPSASQAFRIRHEFTSSTTICDTAFAARCPTNRMTRLITSGAECVKAFTAALVLDVGRPRQELLPENAGAPV